MNEFLSRDYFESLQKKLFPLLKSHEHLILTLAGESSQFIRLNGAGAPPDPKVRQIGTVSDATIGLVLIYEGSEATKSQPARRRAARSVTLSGIGYLDQAELVHALEALQSEAREIPVDPYVQLPENRGQSSVETRGRFPSIEEAAGALIEPCRGLDLAGIYAAGTSVRGMADSAGTFHWFSTDTFSFDHSLYTPALRASKSMYAGRTWDRENFAAALELSRKKLDLLSKPAKRLDRGSYRAYLEPKAFSDLVQMLSWGAIGEASIRQGDSPLQKLRNGSERFSPLFNLSEDFRGGESPRFNDEGELAPEQLVLIDRGKLKSTLVSTRTAKEYGLDSNFAAVGEALRAPSVEGGELAEAGILERLGTGLYLSNLHYLNWSDQPGGRITGMTRFACFWVENGKIICPIENMRFDDTIFRFFGSSLEALTESRAYLPDAMSYGMRALGGIWAPGALLSEMTFTI